MINTRSIRHAAASALLATMLLTACGSDTPESLIASGKGFMAKNDNKAAIIQIKNALQKNANLPEARFLLGKALLAGGDPAAAEVELRKALDLKYPADQTIPLLARALLEMGKYQKVIDDFASSTLTAEEGKADLSTTLAIAHATLGDKDAAEAALSAALTALPDFAPAMIVQARLKAANSDIPTALALTEAVLTKATGNHDAWKLKGDLLFSRDEAEPALAAYRKSLELKADQPGVHTSIITLLLKQSKLDQATVQIEAMKKAAPKHPQTIYMEALLAYQKKNFAKAREAAQQLLKIVPNNPKALLMVGEIDFQLRSYAQAEAHLTKAVQLAPGLDRARRFLSMTYLRMNQPVKALDILQPVMNKIADDANMLALVGEAHMYNGDTQKAEEYFTKALALDPTNPAKRTALAVTHLARANGAAISSAFAELEQIAATDTGVSADLVLISSLLTRKEYDKALEAINALEKKQADNPIVHYMRGRTLLEKKDIAAARKSFEQALKISPVYFPAVANLVNLDLAEKRLENAKKHIEGVLAADPKHVPALLAMAELRAREGGTVADVAALIGKAITANPTDPSPRIALTNLYLVKKDAKKAAAVAQEAAAALPDNPAILDMLGRTQHAAGDTNQALAAYSKLAAMQATSPLPHLRMAEIQMSARNRDAAQQSLRKALEIQPDLIDAQRALVVVYLDARKPQEAVAVAREVQKQRPKEAIGYALEGDIAITKKSWAEAATSYRNALKQSPLPELAIKLHGALLAANNTAEADSFAASWLKAHPQDFGFRLSLADVALARKNLTAASQHYRLILEAQPNNALVLNNLAWVAGRQKDPKAIEYAEKANQLVPDQPPFMDTLAELLSEKGDTARALSLQQKAVQLAPQVPGLRLNLARLQIKTGDKSAARKELESLAKLGTKFPRQAEVEQLMKDL